MLVNPAKKINQGSVQNASFLSLIVDKINAKIANLIWKTRIDAEVVSNRCLEEMNTVSFVYSVGV